MRSLYRGAMTLLVILLIALAGASSALASPEGKVYVCKYVGTPGVDETLQTGQNPIEVSINAIPDYQGVGSYFVDAQGRSYVLATVPQDPEPSVSDCPGGPQPSPTTTPSLQPSQPPTPEPSVTPSPTPTPSTTSSPTPSPTSTSTPSPTEPSSSPSATGSLVPPIQTTDPLPPTDTTGTAYSASADIPVAWLILGLCFLGAAIVLSQMLGRRPSTDQRYGSSRDRKIGG